MTTLAPLSAVVIVPANNKSDASLVYYINLLFIALLAVYAVIRLPRLFSLLSIPSEWKNGHILRYTPSKDYERDASHIFHSHTCHVQSIKEKGSPSAMIGPPPHICLRLLRSLLALLRARIAPGFSVARLFVVATYFYPLLYIAFYKSNIFTDSARTGWICMGQLPFVFVFAQKNNIIGAILGYGYEKLNFFHRFVGRLVVLAANIHALHYFYSWSLAGTFKQSIKYPNAIWGTLALVCLDMITFFSTQYWRQEAYNLVLFTHTVGLILVIPSLYLHKPPMLPYIFTCVALYTFDHVSRLVKSRSATALINPVPELGLTRVEIPTINAGWRAGQHVRLRVVSTEMGWLGWAEVHPFTIASVAEGGPEGMVLMCKGAGGWTRKLYDIANLGGYEEESIVQRKVRVVVEGPYGGPQRTIFSSFSAAVFVAGGSGITFTLSVIQDLVQKDLRGTSRVKIIELIWIIPDRACLSPLFTTLSKLAQQSVLNISVFYTRVPTAKEPAFFSTAIASPCTASALVRSSSSPSHPPSPQPQPDPSASAQIQPQPCTLSLPQASDHQQIYFPSGLTLAPGKPHLLKFLEHAINRAVILGHSDSAGGVLSPTGLVVGVCGPVGLADDVAAAVNGLDPVRRDQVGGVELYEEVFGW